MTSRPRATAREAVARAVIEDDLLGWIIGTSATLGLRTAHFRPAGQHVDVWNVADWMSGRIVSELQTLARRRSEGLNQP